MDRDKLQRTAAIALFFWCTWSWIACSTKAQQLDVMSTDQARSIPYRRVFVPQADLNSLGLDGFSPIDIKELEQSISKYSYEYAYRSKTDRNSNEASGQLLASHYMARMIGADLVSDRSRLILSRPHRRGERLLLQPWSLAISSKLYSSATNYDASWTFDEQGLPRVPFVSNETDRTGISSPYVNGEIEQWFGWSVRAKVSSQPHRLSYSLDIPVCADSCLVLSLPPRAVVLEASTVARRLNSWEQVSSRLQGWPEPFREPSAPALPATASESLWLIELGGARSVSFSILLGESERGMDLRGNDDAFRFTQMVRSQRLDHTISGQEIRTQCSAEVMLSQHNQLPIRVRLAIDARLHKWNVQGMDAPWDLSEGWVEWTPVPSTEKTTLDSLTVGTSPTSYIPITAEFVTPLKRDANGQVVLPTFAFDRAYVLTGRTSIQAIAPWRVNNFNCNARIAEPTSNARNTAPMSMEWAWQGAPPHCTIGLELESTIRKVDMLSQISMGTVGAESTVRARFDFLDQDRASVAIVLSPQWRLISAEAMDPTDPVKFVRTESENLFELRWDRIERNRIADVELQLLHEYSLSQKSAVQIVRPFTIVRFPGFEQTNTTSIEESSSHQFIIDEQQMDRMLSDDAIVDWQRRLLPRTGRTVLFQHVSSLTDGLEGDDLFEIKWQEKPNLHRAAIETKLLHDPIHGLTVQHEFQVDWGADRKRPLEIALPYEGVRWSRRVDDHWISCEPIEKVAGVEKTGTWQFELFEPPNSLTLRATLSIAVRETEQVAIVLPRLENTQVGSHWIRNPSNAFDVRSTWPHNRWTIDEAGYAALQIQSPNIGSGLIVKPLPRKNTPWSGWFRELHVAVDLRGTQKCSLVLSSPQAILKEPLTLDLENGWVPVSGRLRIDQYWFPLRYTLDGQRLILGTDSQSQGLDLVEWNGSIECQLEFVGPSLKTTSVQFGASRQSDFQWPFFRIDALLRGETRSLWLPSELTIANHTIARSLPPRNSEWPLWNQTQSIFFRDETDNFFDHELVEERLSSHNDFLRKLRQTSFGNPWRCVLISPSNREWATAESMSTIQIVSRDGNQSFLLALFASIVIITPWLIQLNFRIAVAMCVGLILLTQANWLVVSSASYAGLVGMCIGFCVYSLHRILHLRVESETTSNRRSTTRWAPWNLRDDRTEPSHSEESSSLTRKPTQQVPFQTIVSTTNRVLLVLAVGGSVIGLLIGLAMQAKVYGQSEVLDDRETYEILIPVDATGDLLGTNVYIPDELRNLLAGRTSRPTEQEMGVRATLARHVLKIGGRGKPDQIVMNYEFIVGDDLNSLRFQIADQMQTLRFFVDGTELNQATRLRRVGGDWIWSPEKPGRRVIQIIGQPKLTNLDSSKEPSASLVQQLDLSLIPVANATVDIEVDPQYMVDLMSLGQFTNPSAGRFSAMIGSLDRLQCRFSIPMSVVPSGLAPTLTSADNLESSLMHTELFLNHDTIQAKTLFEFPKGMLISKQIEIEADSQWLPIGTSWGDAHWVELRPGSTLSRRRFVLEWNVPPTSTLNQRDRRIIMLWVPQSDRSDLNVLFAECRNHRSRFGTLRYARTLGSEWSIEGVNTWATVLGSEERLDWPDLKSSSNPIATTLRIPFNGGGGILKQRVAVSRQQARVSSNWSLDPNTESLSVRVELIGGQNAEPLYLELPADFQVLEATYRNEPIRYLHRTAGDRKRMQFIADQSSLEIGDIKIQAKRQIRNTTGTGVIPWVHLPSAIETEQTIKVFASERIALRFENISGPSTAGRGTNQSIASLTRNERTTNSSLVPMQYEVTHRNQPTVGFLVASASPNGMYEAAEIEVGGVIERSLDSRPALVIETPSSLKDRWQSDLRINSLPCPDATKAWLQIMLPEWESESSSKARMSIRFFPGTEDPQELIELAGQIRPLASEPLRMCLAIAHNKPKLLAGWQPVSDSLKQTVLQELGLSHAAEVFERRATPEITTAEWMEEEPMPILSIAQAVYEIAAVQNARGSSEQTLLSRFWIANDADQPISQARIHWTILENVQVLSVRQQGKEIPYLRRGDELECEPVLAGLSAELVITTKHSIDDPELPTIHAPFAPKLPAESVWVMPILFGTSRILIDDQEYSPRELNEMIGLITEKWLKLFASVLDREILEQRQPGSDWDEWQRYWTRRSLEYLNTWASSDQTDDDTYGAAVETFHELRSILHASQSSTWNAETTNQINPPQLASPSIELSPLTQTASAETPSRDQNIALAGYFFVLTCVVLFSRNWMPMLEHRPWWYLLALGMFIWIFSGWLMPAILLGLLGLAVQLDTYWISSERLRRTGTRGLRSP